MSDTTVCNCIGPQNGEPKCPCLMKNVIKRDGRWTQKEVDLGPIPGYGTVKEFWLQEVFARAKETLANSDDWRKEYWSKEFYNQIEGNEEK